MFMWFEPLSLGAYVLKVICTASSKIVFYHAS
jgi:hypothetical protein